MNDYVRVRLDLMPCSPDMTDLMAAFLADIGYESFVPDENGLEAFIPATLFSKSDVRNIIDTFPFETKIEFSHESVEGRDWNEEWEKNYFKPIVIADRCVIHSTFHKDVPGAEYDIVIDPKMAFGTGHHATTSMMVTHLLKRDLTGKRVIDMGTGTGILAILSIMRGAEEAFGVEIDPAAAINARENADLNFPEALKKPVIITGDASQLPELPKADLFMANINRNVILADIPHYADAMKDGAEMLLSGFYEADIPIIQRAASMYGLEFTDKLIFPGEWASCVLSKEN